MILVVEAVESSDTQFCDIYIEPFGAVSYMLPKSTGTVQRVHYSRENGPSREMVAQAIGILVMEFKLVTVDYRPNPQSQGSSSAPL